MARILVVDDTPQNLALIELYLRATEFEVLTATSGKEAIELSREQLLDLILLDIVMPGIDGFEVCRRLKNDPRMAFVPVIFLTGHISDESEKAAAYQLGAVDYIQKPVDRDELVARIRVMLRLEDTRSRLDRENAALREQLGKTKLLLTEASEALLDLQELRRAIGTRPASGMLVLSPTGAIEHVDPGSVVTPEQAARQMQDLLVAGRAGGDVALGEQLVAVDRRDLPDGRVVLLVNDVTARRAVERRLVDREAITVPATPVTREQTAYRMSDFVGSAPAVLELTERVSRLRQSRATVMIQGETGTGKELVARALHFDGQNRSAPFIPLHCGAMAPELIESELFGHEKGAFTGAQQAHEGLFRAADGGTIFLDEIAETSPSLQVKLLRVLQRGEIRPVGANQPRIVDVRIIAATNRALLELVREGRFREDLYYRLEVVTLNLPPLRERLDDLPELANHFVRVCNRRYERVGRPVRGISRGAMQRLLAYSWPGNVRELENVIERAFALGVGEVLREADLPAHVLRGQPALGPSPVQRGPMPLADIEPLPDLRRHREIAEREVIEAALRRRGGDKSAAATDLGMARSTFYRRIRELGL